MMLSGVTLVAFLIYHLLHFTLRTTDPVFKVLLDDQGRHDVYSMVVLGFQDNTVAIAYVLAMVVVGYHLSHSISSMFQSLGLNGKRTKVFVERLGPIVATLFVAGNVVMPLAIQLGYVTLPMGAP